MEEFKIINYDVLRGALELYRREVIAGNMCKELSIEYSDKIDEETSVHGVSYKTDVVSNTSIRVTPYINELIVMQSSYEMEQKEHEKKAKKILSMYDIAKRLQALKPREQRLINEIYFEGGSITEVALSRNKSKKYISEGVSNAISKMADVDIYKWEEEIKKGGNR